jgi:hypothetical protein
MTFIIMHRTARDGRRVTFPAAISSNASAREAAEVDVRELTT